MVNPGAWTHYQWSIRDALEVMGAPFVEVHLSDIESREPHRRVSVVRDIASAAVWGKGPDGYRDALDHLASGARVSEAAPARQDRLLVAPGRGGASPPWW